MYEKIKEELESRIIIGFDECDCMYRGFAIFPTSEDRDACIRDYEEFQLKWREECDWHEEHDDDEDAWFNENRYGAEVLEEYAMKHGGVFMWNEWNGEAVLV